MMAMDCRYAAVVDVFALVATYPLEAQVLRETTQAVALAYLRRQATRRELEVLLRLAKDLGYASDELYEAHRAFL